MLHTSTSTPPTLQLKSSFSLASEVFRGQLTPSFHSEDKSVSLNKTGRERERQGERVGAALVGQALREQEDRDQ